MSKIISTGRRCAIFALAILIMCTFLPAFNVNAASELGWGGVEYAWQDLNVYNAKSGGSIIGKIYKNESFTVLEQNGPAGYLWVDYSTSKGSKQGYVHIQQDELGGRSGAPAKVKNTSNVYFGRNDLDSNYKKAGAVYSGEYVSVIAVSANWNWAYIEYNTTSGRKRGYTPYYNLDVSNNRWDGFPSIYNDSPASDRENHGIYHIGKATVYSGPTELYAVVGSVENERIYQYGNQVYVGPYRAQYIEYYVTGTNELKSGFLVYK